MTAVDLTDWPLRTPEMELAHRQWIESLDCEHHLNAVPGNIAAICCLTWVLKIVEEHVRVVGFPLNVKFSNAEKEVTK
jgi:hypothetical protein